ncbi:MAG: DinB family protein, partial [Gemmatimonadales bacterium]
MFESLLDEALEAWTDARQGVIAELENLPAESFTARPVPGMRSVAEMAVHILEVAQMMVGELSREDTDFRRLPWPDLLQLHAGDLLQLTERDELLAALRTTLEEGIERFREVGELHMLQTIERFDGERGTRIAWLQHGIAQEMYHRGQLAVYARLLGEVPAMTMRIEAAG